MREELSIDTSSDHSSHYEVSLTAGQAFIAFVLLLFSLAASFAFGLIIGRGQSDERLVVRKDPTVVSESAGSGSRSSSRILELGGDEQATLTDTTASAMTSLPPSIVEDSATSDPLLAVTQPAPALVEVPRAVAATGEAVPHIAQLLSTTDSTTAEGLAARLIDAGFTTAYVERNLGEQGTTYRVRVRFVSEQAARAAADQLRTYSKGDVWITPQ